VRQFSHEHGLQVLYLTCSDRFDSLADELVVLPGPSKERVLAMPKAGATEPQPELQPDKTESTQPTLRFAPDPRSDPDPVAQLRSDVDADARTDVADPFGLGRSGGSETPD
jgi:hypothetical protein